MNHNNYNDDDEEEEMMMLKTSMEREDTYDPNEYSYGEYDEHGGDDGEEAPLEDEDDDQYSDEEIPSGGRNFNFFIQGGKIPIRETPAATNLLNHSNQSNQRQVKEEDDFEYNMEESEDDEIYPISSDDESPSSLQQIKPSIQTVIRRKTSPMEKSPLPEEKKSVPQSNSRPLSNAPNKIRATPTKTTAPVLRDTPDKYSDPDDVTPPRPKLALGAIGRYSAEDDVRSLTSSRTSNNSDLSIGGEDKMKNQLDYLKQKQDQLYKLNQQLNVETKQVLKETDDIVKQQSKKVESISTRTPSRPGSSASTVRSNTPSSTHRSNASTAATTRPASAQLARKKITEKIEEVTQFEDDELDRAANEMGVEAAMKFYKARVKSLQKDIQDFNNQSKLKDDKIKELDIKYNATMIENKKIVKAQSQFHSRLDRQRKDFDSLQLKFKKQTTMMNEMQKENEKLKQNIRVDGPGSKDTEATPGNNNDRIKDLKYTRALEEVEKLKSQLSEVQKQQREDNDKQRKESENLRKDNKRLERQKQDIVLAFKKQMKLIDVLKRQIIHLEASKQLSFTEEEFTSLMNQ